MVRLDWLLFGYRKLEISEKDIIRASNILLKSNIRIKLDYGSVLVSETDFKKIKMLFEGKIEYTASVLLGVRGLLVRHRRDYGVFAALILSALIFAFSSSVVWDIRVEGSLDGREEAVLEELSEIGFTVGVPWYRCDKNAIEAELLEISENVSWVNINRRGTVAYVSVIDKASYPDSEEPRGYANIVAERDCVIEEISVVSGYAAVRAGETVRKGQILISGVIPLEQGGGFCRAEGTVIGRYSGSVSVSVSETETVKQPFQKDLRSFSFVFFKNKINIFKKYGNLPEDCVIIEDKRDFDFFGIRKLPFGTLREYSLSYTEATVFHTESDMVRLAAERHKEALSKVLFEKELLRIETHGEFSGDFYNMNSDFVCRSNIAVTAEFQIESD